MDQPRTTLGAKVAIRRFARLANSRKDTHSLRGFECGKDRRKAEGGARLEATFGAVADEDAPWGIERCLELDLSALAGCFHFGQISACLWLIRSLDG